MDSIGLNLRFRSCYPLFLYIMLSSIKYNLIVAEILLVEESPASAAYAPWLRVRLRLPWQRN